MAAVVKKRAARKLMAFVEGKRIAKVAAPVVVKRKPRPRVRNP